MRNAKKKEVQEELHAGVLGIKTKETKCRYRPQDTRWETSKLQSNNSNGWNYLLLMDTRIKLRRLIQRHLWKAHFMIQHETKIYKYGSTIPSFAKQRTGKVVFNFFRFN